MSATEPMCQTGLWRRSSAQTTRSTWLEPNQLDSLALEKRKIAITYLSDAESPRRASPGAFATTGAPDVDAPLAWPSPLASRFTHSPPAMDGVGPGLSRAMWSER